ncbi:MAG: YdeI/OmpD-associated family protein [Thermomicrobiales bacterium]
MAKPVQELPVMTFATASAFENWLAENFEEPAGLWVKVAKKASGIASVTHPEALDIALCFGWIDGQRRAFDDDYFLQKFTPRRPRSKWSKINRDKVLQLIEDGRMRPSGMAQIEAARADGRWQDAYASQSRMTVPEDLQVRLDEQPDASRFFDSLDSRNRYAILYRIQDAKRAETRVRRIEQFMEMLMNGEKIY